MLVRIFSSPVGEYKMDLCPLCQILSSLSQLESIPSYDTRKSNISPFFEDKEGLQFDPQKSVPGLVYRLLCHLKRRLVIDRARRRILLTVLHKLLALFGRERIKGEALRILASAILGSGLAGTDLGAIQDNLADWTKKGKRYSKLGNHLGGSGTIILLPYDIGDTV